MNDFVCPQGGSHLLAFECLLGGMFVENKADKIAILPFLGSLAFSLKHDMKFSK